MDLKKVEKISKALGDENRLKILKAIQSNNDKLECSMIMEFLKLSQPSISHHVKKLIEADLIVAEKEGRHYFYSLNEPMLKEYLDSVKNL